MSGPRVNTPSAAVYRRRRLVALGAMAVVVFLIGLALAGWAGSSPGPATSQPPPAPASTTTTVAPTTTTTSTTDPGLLPQTTAEPSTDPVTLATRLAPLWKSIQYDDAATGATIFFPESAYLQMKTGAISAPASDYQNRLVALFTMDLGTYQQALGTPPASAVLTGVEVDPSIAHWVVPGTCANHIGYWHLPNIRLVYSNHGTTSSFGVFSLISWRGEWFVVHLGPVPRNSGAGLLDLPAAGPGTPGPGGGC